jgi:hypothetical protein
VYKFSQMDLLERITQLNLTAYLRQSTIQNPDWYTYLSLMEVTLANSSASSVNKQQLQRFAIVNRIIALRLHSLTDDQLQFLQHMMEDLSAATGDPPCRTEEAPPPPA